jgi:hypothetical protein
MVVEGLSHQWQWLVVVSCPVRSVSVCVLVSLRHLLPPVCHLVALALVVLMVLLVVVGVQLECLALVHLVVLECLPLVYLALAHLAWAVLTQWEWLAQLVYLAPLVLQIWELVALGFLELMEGELLLVRPLPLVWLVWVILLGWPSSCCGL